MSGVSEKCVALFLCRASVGEIPFLTDLKWLWRNAWTEERGRS